MGGSTYHSRDRDEAYANFGGDRKGGKNGGGKGVDRKGDRTGSAKGIARLGIKGKGKGDSDVSEAYLDKELNKYFGISGGDEQKNKESTGKGEASSGALDDQLAKYMQSEDKVDGDAKKAGDAEGKEKA